MSWKFVYSLIGLGLFIYVAGKCAKEVIATSTSLVLKTARNGAAPEGVARELEIYLKSQLGAEHAVIWVFGLFVCVAAWPLILPIALYVGRQPAERARIIDLDRL